MLTTEAIKKYLDSVVVQIEQDANSKGQKLPAQGFRIEVSEEGGKLYGAEYFKYLVLGRGPGKFPPKNKMLEVVEKNPEMLAEAKKRFKYITAHGLAYLIGRKIAREGTDIFTGKKKGIDFLGAMEVGMPDLLKEIARNEAVKFLTVFRKELNGTNTSTQA